MAHDAPNSTSPFVHDAPAPSPSIRRAPSNFDEGFSEETQSQVDSDIDMAREPKDISDRTMGLLRALDSLSLDERLDIMRNTAGALPADFQLREYNLRRRRLAR